MFKELCVKYWIVINSIVLKIMKERRNVNYYLEKNKLF